MKYSLAAASLLAATTLAHPLEKKQATNIDPTILQFALTLEHLENVFYHNALQNFTEQDFVDAGYSSTYYNNLKYISYDEQSHVQLLTNALAAAGAAPVAACTYKFPYTDVSSFITLSSVLEGVGTSAYLAGAPLITNKQYLTVAGSILVTEALHTSYQRAAVGEVPMANPYGTPLDPTSVFTLAAAFIVSCPASNAPLPFTPFPALAYTPSPACTCEEPDCSPSSAIKKRWSWDGQDWSYGGGDDDSNVVYEYSDEGEDYGYDDGEDYDGYYNDNGDGYNGGDNNGGYNGGHHNNNNNYCAPPAAGASITLTAASAIPAGSYVTFVSGLSVVSVQGTISGSTVTVTIPSIAMGQTYVLISSSDVEGAVDDTKVLFGPAIVEVYPPAPAIDYSVV